MLQLRDNFGSVIELEQCIFYDESFGCNLRPAFGIGTTPDVIDGNEDNKEH